MQLKNLLFTNALIVGVFVLFYNSSVGQSVAINDNHSAPNSSAILDINTFNATKKGLLIPRLTTTEISSIALPADGLMVYDTDLKQLKIYKITSGWSQADFSLPYTGNSPNVGLNNGVFEISYSGFASATKYAAFISGGNANGLTVTSENLSAIKAVSNGAGTAISASSASGIAIQGSVGIIGVGVKGVASGSTSTGVEARNDADGDALNAYSLHGSAIKAGTYSGYAGTFLGKVIMSNAVSTTFSPNLDVRDIGSGNYTRLTFSNGNYTRFWTLAGINNGATAATDEFNIYNSGYGNALNIKGNGNICYGGTISQCSDARLKKDITPLNNSLNDLLQLNGYTYFWKDEHKDTRKQIGLLAQEVQKVLPLLVNTDTNGMMSVNYSGMIPVIINAMKELKEENEELKKRLVVLEKRM